MKKLNLKRGFTLIELLVVVAIIGILASVVLAALNNARSKGGDAGVKTNLHTVSTQAGLFYENNNLSFLPSGGSDLNLGPCPIYYERGSSMVDTDKSIADAIVEATLRGNNTNACYNSGSTWAVAVGLTSSDTASWCVDSEGSSRQVDLVPEEAIDKVAGVCN